MNGLDPRPPARGPACPAPAVLEALSAGEDPGAPVLEHVHGCADCGAYVAALVKGREDFNRMRPAPRFIEKLNRREEAARARRRPWLGWLGGLVAAGVAVAVVAPSLMRDGSQVLEKGGGFSVVYRRSPEGTPTPVQPDARLKKGDALRFSYRSEVQGQLLVLDLDGTGRASVFHPFGGTRSAPLDAGNGDFLPGSVLLDDAPGPEWIIAVFSPAPQEAAPLLEQLRGQQGASQLRLDCEGCKVTALRVQKTP